MCINRKKLLSALLSISLTALTACAASGNGSSSQVNPAFSSTQVSSSSNFTGSSSVASAKKAKVTLVADFSAGSELDDQIKTYEEPYSGTVTADGLAKSLSSLSNLDFTINGATRKDRSITVDWSKKSTLIAGLDDREQKDGFHFFDVDSLNWFMMDSLYRTILKNFDVDEVYYTMDGGKDLVVSSADDFPSFSSKSPYMGEAFYLNHADNKGESMDDENNESGLNKDAAMNYLLGILKKRIASMEKNLVSGATVMLKDDETVTVNGENCFAMSLGTNFKDKFTVEEHFAVSPSGMVYRLDIIKNQYVQYEPED